MRACGIAVLVGAFVCVAFAANSAREILDARRRLYETKYSWSGQHQVMRVTTVGRDRVEQTRMIETYERRYPGGDRKTLLLFLAPDNVKDTAVMSQAHAGGPTERWLYLPRLKKARRFAAQMRDEGVLGTDLTARELDLLDAMLKWTIRDVHATVSGAEPIEGVLADRLEILPSAQRMEYDRALLWVGREDLVMRQLELYGADGALVKRIRQRDVKFVGAVPVPLHVEVENPRTRTRSEFDVVDVDFDGDFPDAVFSLPSLDAVQK
jgi:hypothetical protein